MKFNFRETLCHIQNCHAQNTPLISEVALTSLWWKLNSALCIYQDMKGWFNCDKKCFSIPSKDSGNSGPKVRGKKNANQTCHVSNFKHLSILLKNISKWNSLLSHPSHMDWPWKRLTQSNKSDFSCKFVYLHNYFILYFV